MNVLVWILQGVLAAAFAAAGATKSIQSKEKLAKSGMAWVEDFAPGVIKLIAGAELLAAVGLILPGATDIVTVLTPIAATGLAVVMVGAILTHARRREPREIAINVVLLAVAVVIAWARFGPYAF
jgi:ABC-type Fe3+-siderophore transport system permease subunit